MDLVIDANILFAALLVENVSAKLIYNHNIHLYAPDFLFEEFEKYKQLLLEKSNRTEEEFNIAMKLLKKKIRIIAKEEFQSYLEKALQISPDHKDAAYFAIALKMKIPLWSNDKQLKGKQNIITVYSTHELVKLLNINL